jgi:hypothetical protein
MLQLTVKSLTGEEQQFIDVDETSTVSAFNSVVATSTGSPVENFRMYRGATYLAMSKTLKDVGVVDGAKLSMHKRQDKQSRAEVRVNKIGTRPKFGGAACSSKYDVRAAKEDVIDAVAGVEQKVDATAADTKVIKNVLMGKEVPRHADQSGKERLKQLRTTKRIIDNEIGDLREEEGNRLAAAKRAAANALLDSAVVAEGAVQFVAGDISTCEDVKNKKAELVQQHKACQKVLDARAKELRVAEQKALKNTKPVNSPKPSRKRKSNAIGEPASASSSKGTLQLLPGDVADSSTTTEAIGDDVAK